MVFGATFLPRFFAMRSAGEVRPLATQQSSSLFSLRLIGRNTTQPRLPNLLSRFWRADVATSAGMLCGMVFGRQALKVFHSVVSFIAIDMMHVFTRVKRLQPARSNNSVHQTLSAQMQVAIRPLNGSVGLELSENFSAARDGVKVVKESVLDSVYFYAQHAVPFKVAKES